MSHLIGIKESEDSIYTIQRASQLFSYFKLVLHLRIVVCYMRMITTHANA